MYVYINIVPSYLKNKHVINRALLMELSFPNVSNQFKYFLKSLLDQNPPTLKNKKIITLAMSWCLPENLRKIEIPCFVAHYVLYSNVYVLPLFI